MLRALGSDRAVVVGNDTGGTIAQVLATEHPEYLSGVVISASDAYDNFPPTVFAYLCWLARVPALLTAGMHAMRLKPVLRSPLGYGWLTRAGIPEPVANVYLRRFRRIGPTRDDLVRFLVEVNSVPTLEAARGFVDVEAPALVLWSRDDRVFPLAHGRRMARELRAELSITHDASAYLPIDAPSWFADEVNRFIDTLPAGAQP
jgi:pimeloyl-ACP methyl ester carboxylesterase